MPTPPDSTKSSLEQRLCAYARERWPNIELAVWHRAGFAYVDAHLPDGDVLPLLRLRYGGSATHWGVALYRPSTGKYEDQPWFTGTPVEALDFAERPAHHGRHLSPKRDHTVHPQSPQLPRDLRR